jgi:hypothetical protein
MADNSPKELGGQLHSYLSITHGLVDLAMATGEKKYLDQAIKIYHATLPYLWINGVVPEHVGVFEHRDESCALVDWILLLSKLYDATGEAHYLDTLEFCTVNGLLFNQHNNGGFVTYRSVDRHKWMSDHNRGVDHDHCCTMHGGIGITYATAHIVTQSAEGLSVNLPLGADVSLKQNGKDVKLSQKIDVKPTVLVQKIHIKNSGKKPLSIKVRVPYWCDSPALQVDGKKQPLKIKDGFINLSCKGKSEQNIEMTLPMKLVVIPARKNILTLDTAGAPGKAVEEGLQYGPYALMFFREMYKEVKERHLSVTVPLENGRPIMSQKLPEGWRAAGSVPLLIKAKLGNGADVWLTPGANSTMMQFSVVDPYVFRFAKVTVSK